MAGPRFCRPGWLQLASTVALLLQFSDAPLRDVLEARKAIEPGVARMAAERATDADIKAMDQDLLEMEAEIGHYRRFSSAYLRFWNHLAESTHNAFLTSLSPALRAVVNSGGFVPNEPYRVVLVGRLRSIHGAVSRHDVEAAGVAMAAVEDEFLDRLVTGYPRQVERPVAWSDLNMDPDAAPAQDR